MQPSVECSQPSTHAQPGSPTPPSGFMSTNTHAHIHTCLNKSFKNTQNEKGMPGMSMCILSKHHELACLCTCTWLDVCPHVHVSTPGPVYMEMSHEKETASLSESDECLHCTPRHTQGTVHTVITFRYLFTAPLTSQEN